MQKRRGQAARLAALQVQGIAPAFESHRKTLKPLASTALLRKRRPMGRFFSGVIDGTRTHNNWYHKPGLYH